MRLSAGLRQTRRPDDDRVLGALAGGCRDLPVLHPLFCRHPGFAVALHDDGPHLCRGAGRADPPEFVLPYRADWTIRGDRDNWADEPVAGREPTRRSGAGDHGWATFWNTGCI